MVGGFRVGVRGVVCGEEEGCGTARGEEGCEGF